MSTRNLPFLSALAALLTATAWAATPTAIWDGDFSSATNGGFSITATNSNTIAANAITIASGATGGVVFTGPNSSLNNSTFIIRSTGLNLASASNQYLLSVHQNILGDGNGDESYNKVGVSLAAKNASVNGIWNNGYYTSGQTLAKQLTTGKELVINVQTSGGVFVYEIVTDDATGARTLVPCHSNATLKASNTNYKGFTIGGIYEKSSSTLAPATDWKITSIAVFTSTLSADDMKSYVFPSELVDYTTTEVVSGTVAWSDIKFNSTWKSSVGAVAHITLGGDATITLPDNLLANKIVVSGTGNVTFEKADGATVSVGGFDFSEVTGTSTVTWDTGATAIVAGSDTVVDVANANNTLTIASGKKLTVKSGALTASKVSNNGTLHFDGGTENAPITITGGSYLGAQTLAANTYVANDDKGTNVKFDITGSGATSLYSFTRNGGNSPGMGTGSTLTNFVVVSAATNSGCSVWFEHATVAETVGLKAVGGVILNDLASDPVVVRSLSGSGALSNYAGQGLKIKPLENADYSGTSSLAITVEAGADTATQTFSGAYTGALTINSGAAVALTATPTPSAIVNNGTLKYAYSPKPTIANYSGDGAIVVDMTGIALTSGEQYKVVNIIGVDVSKVSVTGVDATSGFTLYAVADGIVLADEQPDTALWTGDSGTWSDTTFDGKTIATAGVPVGFTDATSGATAVTVTLDGAKSVTTANFSAKTTAYTLTGGALTVTDKLNLDGTAAVTFKTAPTLPNAGLTGSGPLVLDFGAGTTNTMSANNTAYTGEATIASGTIKMGDARSFGEFGRSASVRVKGGATLDANGQQNGANTGVNNKLILEEGATFANSVNVGDTKMFSFYDLTVDGDSTIDASSVNNGLTRHYNSETYIHLGENTLTKTGGNTFYVSAPTIDGSGTIEVSAGTLSISRAYNTSTQPTFPDGTIKIDSGAYLNLQDYAGGANLTVKNLIIEGTGSVNGNGSITATGSVELNTVSGSATPYPAYLSDSSAATVTVSGEGTLAFGTSRPTKAIELGENVKIAARMQSATDSQIKLNLSRNPSSVTVYDASGAQITDATYAYDAETGVLSIYAVCTIEATSGTVDFDATTSWNGGVKPTSGSKVVIKATGDVTLTTATTYADLGLITISGGGTVSFAGNGSITATRVDVLAGSTYLCSNAVVTAGTQLWIYGTLKTRGDITLSSTGNALNAAGVLDVESGTLTLTGGDRTLQGTVYVRRGATLAPQTGDNFNYSGTQVMHVYGTLAMGSIRWTTGGSNTIYLYGGSSVTGSCDAGNIDMNAGGAGHIVAKFNESTGESVIDFSANLRSMNNDNGTIEVQNGVILKMSGKFINTNRITKSGTGYLVLNTPSSSTGGKIWVTEGPAGGQGYVYNLTMDNGTTFMAAPSGLTVNGFYVMKSVVTNDSVVVTNQQIAVDASLIDSASLTSDSLVVLTANGEGTFVQNAFSAAKLSSRFSGIVADASAKTLSLTVGTLKKFYHDNFNGAEMKAESVVASDAAVTIPWGGGNTASAIVSAGKTGSSAWIYWNNDSNCNFPYWASNSANKAPGFAGAMTVTTVAKLLCAKDVGDYPRVLWSLGEGLSGDGIGLAVVNSTTVAAFKWMNGTAVEVARVSNISNLSSAFHFFALVISPNGAKLYVDKVSDETDIGMSTSGIGLEGQFGSVYNGVHTGYANINGTGYYLDDWAVYDTALTESEIKTLRLKLCPEAFQIRIR